MRAAVYASGLGVGGVAEKLDKDRKTVERWIGGKLPYRRNQHALAKLLGADPGYLWPPTSAAQSRDLGMAELMAVWPVRSLVANTAWVDLFEQATRSIDVLVYAGFWLSEDPAIRRVLVRKAKAGVRVRFLLGEPDSAAVLQRGAEEGIGGVISAKIHNTIHNYRTVIDAPNTTLPVPRHHALQLDLPGRPRDAREQSCVRPARAHDAAHAPAAGPGCRAVRCLPRQLRTGLGRRTGVARRAAGRLMARRDYYDDPAAPAANSIVPAVTAVVTYSNNQVLLIHRSDNDRWALPGGGIELGESAGDALIREVREETGIDVEVTALVGIYSDPRHVIAYDEARSASSSLCASSLSRPAAR